MKLIPFEDKLIVRKVPTIDVRQQFPQLIFPNPNLDGLMVVTVETPPKDMETIHRGDVLVVTTAGYYPFEFGKLELMCIFVDDIIFQIEEDDD